MRPRPAAAVLAAAVLLLPWAPPASAQTIPLATIDDGPKKQAKKRTARFAFSSDDPAAAFECRLDDAAFEPCSSPTILRGIERGMHLFEVRAISAEGVVSTPAAQRWKIVRKSK